MLNELSQPRGCGCDVSAIGLGYLPFLFVYLTLWPNGRDCCFGVLPKWVANFNLQVLAGDK